MDLTKLLTPEARRRHEETRAWEAERRAEFAGLSDENLAASAKFYMQHCEAPRRHAPGEPVYDATLWHVILPELIRRLEER